MCLSAEQRALFENLNVEEACATPEQMRLTRVSYDTRQGYPLPSEVRMHHADLAYRATRSEAGRRAFDEHRAAHREEALRLRDARAK